MRAIIALLVVVAIIAGVVIAVKDLRQPKSSASSSLATAVRSINTGSSKPSSVPFVGCKSDGQTGPVDAPKGHSKALQIDAKAAGQLAYYASTNDFGVLAPRGWNCFGTYGSSSTTLFVSPQKFKQDDLLSETWKGMSGPGIELSWVNGGTSGRFEVAKAIARVFPDHKAFVSDVINEGVEPSSSFTPGPYPKDKLNYRSKEVVEYTTPANATGLGTDSLMKSDSGPISGVLMLTGPDSDLVHLSMRLPSKQTQLESVIVQQLEHEVRSQPNDAPTESADRKPSSRTSHPASADTSKGYPVPEKDFVAAYVLANFGRDGLNQSQLEVLAHDEYQMGKMVDAKDLSSAQALFNTRGGRAMAYIDKIAHQQQ